MATVYQYHYDANTLNFHQTDDEITEYFFEDYLGNTYEANVIDSMFLQLVRNIYQTDKNFTHVSPEDYSVYIENEQPTRIIQQNGWRFRLQVINTSITLIQNKLLQHRSIICL